MIKNRLIMIAAAGILLINIFYFNLSADDWGSNNEWNSWDDKELIEISGYLETTALTVFPRRADSIDLRTGFQNLLRLRSFFEPSSNLSVTVDGAYLDRRGVADPSVRAEMIGMSTSTEMLRIMNNRNSPGFRFDYVYGSFSYRLLDLRIGKQPIAWGTAYAFNPTDLANPSYLSDLAGIEPPGLVALSPSVTIHRNWAFEGYLGFEDRDRSLEVVTELTTFKDHPLGLRLRSFIGAWDFGLGYIRSLEIHQQADLPTELVIEDNAALEFTGSVGGVTIYGEAAVSFDNAEMTTEKSINAAFGFHYQLFGNLGLQVEYHRRGRGEKDPDNYDVNLRLRGGMAARDYLVSVIDFMILNDDVRVVFSSLKNLNDQSTVLFPSLTYPVIQDFELELGGSAFLGKRKSEFDGRFTLGLDEDGEEIKIDVGRPQMYLSGKWYF